MNSSKEFVSEHQELSPHNTDLVTLLCNSQVRPRKLLFLLGSGSSFCLGFDCSFRLLMMLDNCSISASLRWMLILFYGCIDIKQPSRDLHIVASFIKHLHFVVGCCLCQYGLVWKVSFDDLLQWALTQHGFSAMYQLKIQSFQLRFAKYVVSIQGL